MALLRVGVGEMELGSRSLLHSSVLGTTCWPLIPLWQTDMSAPSPPWRCVSIQMHRHECSVFYHHMVAVPLPSEMASFHTYPSRVASNGTSTCFHVWEMTSSFQTQKVICSFSTTYCLRPVYSAPTVPNEFVSMGRARPMTLSSESCSVAHYGEMDRPSSWEEGKGQGGKALDWEVLFQILEEASSCKSHPSGLGHY